MYYHEAMKHLPPLPSWLNDAPWQLGPDLWLDIGIAGTGQGLIWHLARDRTAHQDGSITKLVQIPEAEGLHLLRQWVQLRALGQLVADPTWCEQNYRRNGGIEAGMPSDLALTVADSLVARYMVGITTSATDLDDPLGRWVGSSAYSEQRDPEADRRLTPA